jgi:hypothetical protein
VLNAGESKSSDPKDDEHRRTSQDNTKEKEDMEAQA